MLVKFINVIIGTLVHVERKKKYHLQPRHIAVLLQKNSAILQSLLKGQFGLLPSVYNMEGKRGISSDYLEVVKQKVCIYHATSDTFFYCIVFRVSRLGKANAFFHLLFY